MGRGMCELTLGVSARALVPLVFAAHLEGKPARVLSIGIERDSGVHHSSCIYGVNHGHSKYTLPSQRCVVTMLVCSVAMETTGECRLVGGRRSFDSGEILSTECFYFFYEFIS